MTCDVSSNNTYTLQQVIDACDIVHMCIPVLSLRQPISVRDGQIVILHDSVMYTSQQANARVFGGRASVVHMLMNDHKTVVVAQNTRQQRLVRRHFAGLGFTVIPLSIKRHDEVMARSQAPLAILMSIVLDDLRQWSHQGLLTSSGDVLLQSLEARAVQWTDQTLQSLLSNPMILHFINDLQQHIKGK
jgi:prephenate dehydrogenase